MKLEKIKLSGFKSFVDPTVIPISSNLTAIVGPNGCGKSNIIDAVRWVMGESSAKHLRGGSMVDVIFNGSSTRKPVGTASVELFFDNSEGKLGGEYAQYNNIAIKRQVSRDGISLYLLNGSRCRRKDITDLFLGTGLGSRSYAIIEQGTISRMVESRPEDLRVHIEEAAGISKYKERRSETETRMRHTRENLERLTDLRDEVEKQIKHLQKQSEKAEKYTELKKQERQFRLELLAMRWNSYHQAADVLESTMQTVAIEHNQLFVEQREGLRQQEEKRVEYKNHQQQLATLQGDYYTIAAEVSSLEQTIKHYELNYEETVLELKRTRQQADLALTELETDLQALEEIKQNLFESEENWLVVQQKQEDVLQLQENAEQQRQAWQAQWEVYQAKNSSYREQAQVQRSKTAQLESQQRQLQVRMDKLNSEAAELVASDAQSDIESMSASIEIMEATREELHDQLERLQRTIAEQRMQLKQLHDSLHTHRSRLQQLTGKITSLELLQQHAMGKDNKNLKTWLASMHLGDKQRLAEFVNVESGWESAVETVLGSYLEAICTDNIDSVLSGLQHLTNDSVTLLETGTKTQPDSELKASALLNKVSAPWDLTNLLAGVYCAVHNDSAWVLSKELKGHESVITPDGTWFGPGWLKINKAKDSKTGVLQREKELRELKQQHDELQLEITELEDCLEATEASLKEAEQNRTRLQQQDKHTGMELSVKLADLSAQSARLEQHRRRLQQIESEQQDINAELEETVEHLSNAQVLLEEAEDIIEQQAEKRQDLDALNQELKAQQQQAEHLVNEARQQVYSTKAQIDSLRASESLTVKQIERLQTQHSLAVQRISDLEKKQEQTITPLDEEKHLLTTKILEKDRLEELLKLQRLLQDDLESAITLLNEQQLKIQRNLEAKKENLDKLRFEVQESKVRQQTVSEQLNEVNANVHELLENMPEQAQESSWKSKVDELGSQIERLGTINLTAIEEYKTQTERLNFLNEQHSDLIEALQTLDQAISQIDKQSRLRFKETFDKINNGLQEKFPKLFGGGQAYLELTEQDLLESGVNIIARPPGKKNSSIHLLSGGEKALTAVALVFSIFELNPAPFCLLDEVDAPLDDANVGRFSKMVEEMSTSVQFLYISHNKVTMEIAKQLAGVTMKEPGVSRMVAVDIDEAVSLAEL